ncbi:MAG: NYN domain-containing protein [Acetatifactor sp.]
MQAAKTVIGILAHVDAGKTTLSEAILKLTGVVRKLGRVDHKNTYLDNDTLERERGITIYAKQANFSWQDREYVLLDTPGHVDFSAETERTLQVLDYCILVINGADGVQGHTLTLWKLLKKHHIPVFLFVNKMDQNGTDKQALYADLQERLGAECREFPAIGEETEEFFDELAMCSEELMTEFLETDALERGSIAKAVAARQVFPVYFGSALRESNVDGLLDGIRHYALTREYPDTFGARVFKITRDNTGNRLTHMKITGGVLAAKQVIGNANSAASEADVWAEKVDSIRIYGGGSFSQTDQVRAGQICTVTGLSRSFAGEGLGYEGETESPVLVPVLTYRLVLPEGTDVVKMLGMMRQLEEEEPQLSVVWRESLQEIHVQVMGEVQTEVLQRVIADRFGINVTFADGRLLYRETIADSAEGVGHFEPLRHYAEVHLLLEPAPPGSGLEFATDCPEDVLDRNWQRLILTHLEEKTHVGVLTGSPVTDMKITLLSGKAHQKHTEGGDFRQATYRAVRQGLMQCKSVLLEPVFSYRLELPTGSLGRAMTDIRRMSGRFDPPRTLGDRSVLTGEAPVATMRGYQSEVNSYTRGCGHLICTLKGYEPCHNTEEVLSRIGYDPDADPENPSSSVFCSHGAGFVVQWNQVFSYAHLPTLDILAERESEEANVFRKSLSAERESQTGSGREKVISQEEIDRIFRETYRKSTAEYEPYRYSGRQAKGVYGVERSPGEEKPYVYRPVEKTEEYFLVDGYNIIFAWEELRSLSMRNIDSARDKLIDICCDFQGYIGATLILVYDAYKVKGNPGSVEKHHNIYVVYTKEAETADQYIEKTVHRIGKKYRVTVATSDALEQMIIWGAGAARLSARGFHELVDRVRDAGRRSYLVHDEKRLTEGLGNRMIFPEDEKE